MLYLLVACSLLILMNNSEKNVYALNSLSSTALIAEETTHCNGTLVTKSTDSKLHKRLEKRRVQLRGSNGNLCCMTSPLNGVTHFRNCWNLIPVQTMILTSLRSFHRSSQTENEIIEIIRRFLARPFYQLTGVVRSGNVFQPKFK